MSDPLSVVLRRNVRAERARRGWTQDQLGALIGWSKGTTGHIETGRRLITVDELPKLCRAFGISFVDLLIGANPDDVEPFV